MRRRLYRLGTWLSLLLFAVTVTLYARSFLDADGLSLTWAETRAGTLYLHGRYLISDTGGIIFRSTTAWTTDPEIMARFAEERPEGRQWAFSTFPAGEAWGPPTWVRVLWFGVDFFWQPTRGGTFRQRDVRIPYWAPALLTLLPPGTALLRRRRRRRLRRERAAKGLCPDCGYDLRGTAGRCPECGGEAGAAPTAVPAAPPA